MARASNCGISPRLQALASEGSFGRAAERLGYTQSAVSQQIATLERIVGEKLVERPGGPRAISLTEAGELLLRHADSIVARLQAAQADLQALQAGEVGTLRVGTFQSAGARLLPAVMRRFTAAWPGIEVVIGELDDEEVEQAIERGELDVGFVALPVSDAPLETSELVHDPYVLVVAADSPFATSPEPPTLAEIGAERLIGFKAHRSSRARSRHPSRRRRRATLRVPHERQRHRARPRRRRDRRTRSSRGSPSTKLIHGSSSASSRTSRRA